MIIYKPDTRNTQHLRDEAPHDHRDVLDMVWRFRHASRDTNAVIEGMSMWHKWGALDQHDFYRVMAGPLAQKEIRLVACIPPAVVAMLHYMHPEVLKDREEFYKMLRAHPEWAVPEGAR